MPLPVVNVATVHDSMFFHLVFTSCFHFMSSHPSHSHQHDTTRHDRTISERTEHTVATVASTEVR